MAQLNMKTGLLRLYALFSYYPPCPDLFRHGSTFLRNIMISTGFLAKIHQFFLVFFLIIPVLLITHLPINAQDLKANKTESKLKITQSGLIAGYGTHFSDQKEKHETIFLIWRLGLEMKPLLPFFKNHRGSFSIVLEPQVNPVLSPGKCFGFGVGIGIEYTYPVSEYIKPYFVATIGPHIITDDIKTQARGFIFSDVIGCGVYIPLNRFTTLNFGYRIRHMSNAGFSSPNSGIDHQILVSGISYIF